jgi:hypothetical protein
MILNAFWVSTNNGLPSMTKRIYSLKAFYILLPINFNESKGVKYFKINTSQKRANSWMKRKELLRRLIFFFFNSKGERGEG